jgi:hypothetical protein
MIPFNEEPHNPTMPLQETKFNDSEENICP